MAQDILTIVIENCNSMNNDRDRIRVVFDNIEDICEEKGHPFDLEIPDNSCGPGIQLN